jgi:hypothetical protein
MDEARAVLERLERIEALDRAGAGREALLAELRGLLEEAEAWSSVEGGDAGAAAVDDLRRAMARATPTAPVHDMIAV